MDAPSDYNGPRDSAGIVSYIEKASGPPSVELKSLEDVRYPPCLPHPSCMPPPCVLLRCWTATRSQHPDACHHACISPKEQPCASNLSAAWAWCWQSVHAWSEGTAPQAAERGLI